MTPMMSNTAVKIAPYGRWTPQKRGAFYLGRYKSIQGARHDIYDSSCISASAALSKMTAPP